MISRAMNGALAGVLVILSVLYVGTRCELADLRGEKIEAEETRDSLAAEAAAARAREAGWETAFGATVESLQGELQERDSALARLSEDYHASRVRIEQLTRLTASLEGEGESEGQPTDSVAGDSVPTEWSGTYDDELLRASWRFRRSPEPARLFLEEYRADLTLELLDAVAGDGRTLVTARALDPRVRVDVDTVVVDPPPPEIRETGVSWWWVPASVGVGWLGAETGAFARLLELL